MEVNDSFWYKEPNGPDEPFEKADFLKLTHNAKADVFVQRLVFFICRLRGNTMTEFDESLQRVTSALSIPPEFKIVDELQRLQLCIDTGYSETERAVEERVRTEWRGPSVPTQDVIAFVEGHTGLRKYQQDLNWRNSALRDMIILQYCMSRDCIASTRVQLVSSLAITIHT